MRLREDFNKILARVEKLEEIQVRMDSRLTKMKGALDKLTLEIEEEARSVVKLRLHEMGYDVDVGSLVLPEGEINNTEFLTDYALLARHLLRGGVKLVNEVIRKAALLERKCPEKLGRRKYS